MILSANNVAKHRKANETEAVETAGESRTENILKATTKLHIYMRRGTKSLQRRNKNKELNVRESSK